MTENSGSRVSHFVAEILDMVSYHGRFEFNFTPSLCIISSSMIVFRLTASGELQKFSQRRGLRGALPRPSQQWISSMVGQAGG